MRYPALQGTRSKRSRLAKQSSAYGPPYISTAWMSFVPRLSLFQERQDDQHKNKRLLLGSIATHKLLKRPDLSFSLNMQLGYSQARPPSSVGDSIARYYGATLSRRELIDATEQTLSLRHFSFDDTGLLFSDRSNSINGFIESTSFGPRPRPDGPLQLDISYWRADLAARVMAMTSADNLIFWATSRYDLGAQCTLAHPHHLGWCNPNIFYLQIHERHDLKLNFLCCCRAHPLTETSTWLSRLHVDKSAPAGRLGPGCFSATPVHRSSDHAGRRCLHQHHKALP